MLPGMGDVNRVVAGRYRIDRELWRGPHARSLLATDLRNGRPCVLRRLVVAEASPEAVRRFEAQATILARLDHPGLPRFIDGFFEGEGAGRERVLVTSYHPGESLERKVDRGRPLGEEKALALLRRLVPVLAYLHGFEPPLVHRSIRATGIVVGPDGRPCLTSLDYAVVEPEAPEQAPAPPSPEELALAAPEVYMGVPVPASDIYAVGLAIVRGMTAESPAGLLGEGSRSRLREVLGVSEGFAALVSRMIDPSLERRYADVAALEADLARLAGGKPLGAVRQAERPAEEPSAPRPWVRPLLVVAVVLALAAVAAVALRQRTAPQREPSLLAPPASGTPAAVQSPALDAGAPPVPPPGAPAEGAQAGAPGGVAAPVAPATVPAADAASGPAVAAPAAEVQAPTGGTPPPVTPGAAPVADAAPVVAEGRLLLDGKPFSDPAAPPPSFWFRNQDTKTVVRPAVEYAAGVFKVRDLPPGRYGLSVRIDFEPDNPNIFPGDLNAWSEFTLAPGGTASVEAQLRRIMRLLQPVDNNVLIPGWDVPCGGGSVAPGRLVFAWEPLGPDVRYVVSVDRLACGRGYAPVGRVFSGSIGEAWAKVELPPSREGECYSFRLSAIRDGRPVGVMATHGKGGLGWDYRFTVGK
jgi:hypothetical protein